MGAVLEQEQEEDGRVVKKVIAYGSETLNASQQRYYTNSDNCHSYRTQIALAISVFSISGKRKKKRFLALVGPYSAYAPAFTRTIMSQLETGNCTN